ncbi:MAG: potassium channel family protein [Thermostichus sp. DG02_5_bins_236]
MLAFANWIPAADLHRAISTGVNAVLGYYLAGWALLDAVYMVVITIFGVGYGEVQPLDSPALKVFTILVIVAGTSASVYAVGGFVQLITEGEIQQALGARRMSRGIDTLKEHVIICGFGRIGQVLCRELAQARQMTFPNLCSATASDGN